MQSPINKRSIHCNKDLKKATEVEN